MIERPLFIGLLALLAMCGAQAAFAQAKTYPDGHGGEVMFPQGDVSFAERAVSHDSGVEKPVERARDPAQALGIPDFDDNHGYTTLGCGGQMVLQFIDNTLIDIPGSDLYVFEVGPATEPTALAVSADGKAWVRIGRIEGGKAEVDIAPYINAGQAFQYVKLVDLRSNCGGETPGADIDAVGAIGSARRIAVDSSTLFASGQYRLKPSAAEAIEAAVAGIDPDRLLSVTVAGYTDAVGSEADNMVLSRNRAQAVAAYLVQHAGFPEDKLHIEAHGENNPVASNETAAGRARNRRVELGIRTIASQSGKHRGETARVEILGVWRSHDNELVVLRREDGAVHGTYTVDNGRIKGNFDGDKVLDGYWIEKDSNRTCDTKKSGSKHWGRLRLTFETADLDSFTGKWAYCGEADWHGDWLDGQRVLRHQPA